MKVFKPRSKIKKERKDKIFNFRLHLCNGKKKHSKFFFLLISNFVFVYNVFIFKFALLICKKKYLDEMINLV